MVSIFAYDFMLRAFAAGIITAVIAPTIGLFLVTRRYSFLADTLAHVSLAGVAVGYLTQFNPLLTSIIASIGAALWAEQLRASKRVFGEASLALFLSGGLALAAVLLSVSKGTGVSLSSILFGSITTVTGDDVLLITCLGIVVLLIVLFLRRRLFCIALDEDLAASGGIPVRLLNTILLILAAVTVSLCMRTVGVLLVGALMVIPVISAMQLQQSFKRTLLLSIAFSLLAVLIGLTVSFYAGLSSGGTIVLTAIVIFAGTTVIAQRK